MIVSESVATKKYPLTSRRTNGGKNIPMVSVSTIKISMPQISPGRSQPTPTNPGTSVPVLESMTRSPSMVYLLPVGELIWHTFKSWLEDTGSSHWKEAELPSLTVSGFSMIKLLLPKVAADVKPSKARSNKTTFIVKGVICSTESVTVKRG